MKTPWRWISIAAALCLTRALFAVASAHAGLIADLTADFSSTNNPNSSNPKGIWEYRQGTKDLPLVPCFSGGGTLGTTLPAWAPSDTPGNFLPPFFQVTPQGVLVKTSPYDWQIGDVVLHTVDPFNGNPSLGNANFLFTDKSFIGTVAIAGFVWDAAHLTSRPQDWTLLVDGTQKAAGKMNGAVARRAPQTFTVTGVSLAAGNKVEFDVFKDSASANGYFVGVNLSIGTDTAALSTSTLQFGNVSVGHNSLAKPVAVVATGSTPIHYTQPTVIGPNASDFLVSTAGCAGWISAGTKCTDGVTFAPRAPSGTVETATLEINDDATGHPQQVNLIGTSTK